VSIKSDRRSTTTNPVYERDDPDREVFLRENASALIEERDARIERLRATIRRLEAANAGHRSSARRYREACKSSLELLEGWLGAACDPDCECHLHTLREVLGRSR
jgi:hypothetical protein